MEFPNRNVQSQAAAPGAQPAAAGTLAGSRKSKSSDGKWGRVGLVAAIIAVVVIILGCAIVAGTSNNVNDESKYVDTSKLQAVFLNTGQVYFGKIQKLNSKYLVVTNIYYLQTSNTGGSSSASNANTSVSLVKLGCELHEPYDQMVINRAQVTFWENLQDNGQVGKAVATFQKQNPNGQKCADQSSSSSNNSSNSAQPAGTSNSSVKP